MTTKQFWLSLSLPCLSHQWKLTWLPGPGAEQGWLRCPWPWSGHSSSLQRQQIAITSSCRQQSSPFCTDGPTTAQAGAAGFDLLLIDRVQAMWFPATGPVRVRDRENAATQALSAPAPCRPDETGQIIPDTLPGGAQEWSPPH